MKAPSPMLLKALFVLGSLILFLSFFYGIFWYVSFRPSGLQLEEIKNRFPEEPLPIFSKSKLKVLSWNVQFMAGKNYVFFFDVTEGGPDLRPLRKDIDQTFEEVIRVIKEEDPDVIFLQEMDVHAKRTDQEDQVERLIQALPKSFRYYASSFYWKAGFVPHPKVWGSAGMKLLTISKYPILTARRHQLAFTPKDPVSHLFYLKRCLLETDIQLKSKDREKRVGILNTHLEAFAQGSDTMQKQVDYLDQFLTSKEQESGLWVLAGDFNLLPPGPAYEQLPQEFKNYYQPRSELERFFSKYHSVPSLDDMQGEKRQKWYTHFPNNPRVSGPDRTIDYVFHGKALEKSSSYVRAQDTLKISDHLPVVAEFDIAL